MSIQLRNSCAFHCCHLMLSVFSFFFIPCYFFLTILSFFTSLGRITLWVHLLWIHHFVFCLCLIRSILTRLNFSYTNWRTNVYAVHTVNYIPSISKIPSTSLSFFSLFWLGKLLVTNIVFKARTRLSLCKCVGATPVPKGFAILFFCQLRVTDSNSFSTVSHRIGEFDLSFILLVKQGGNPRPWLVTQRTGSRFVLISGLISQTFLPFSKNLLTVDKLLSCGVSSIRWLSKYSSVWRHTAFRYIVSVLRWSINQTQRHVMSCKCVFGSGSVMVLSWSGNYRQVNSQSFIVNALDLWSIEVFHPLLVVLGTPLTDQAISLFLLDEYTMPMLKSFGNTCQNWELVQIRFPSSSTWIRLTIYETWVRLA